MGKRIPLTKGIGGEEIGTAMVISTGDPIREFGAFARIDGVLVGLSITDPAFRRMIQSDICSLSIGAEKAEPADMDSAYCLSLVNNGEAMARGMQDDIDEGS